MPVALKRRKVPAVTEKLPVAVKMFVSGLVEVKVAAEVCE